MARPALPGIPPPEGIESRHLDTGPLRRHASLWSLGILGAVLAWGVSGYAGDRQVDHVIDNGAGRFELKVPGVVRCGNVIATRIHLVPRRTIDKLVVEVDVALWRQITTNSMVPAAASEASADGRHRFTYDRVDAGKPFDLQIQQQVNPSLFGVNHGRIAFLDGDQPLGDLALDITVLP